MSQKDVADKIGIGVSTYGFYETGEREPTLDTLIQLSEKVFNVSTDYLLGLTDVETPNIEERAITEQYGLNENSLRTLSNIQSDQHKIRKDLLTNTINLFITNNCDIFYNMAYYIYANFNQFTILDLQSQKSQHTPNYKPISTWMLHDENSGLYFPYNSDDISQIFLIKIQEALIHIRKKFLDSKNQSSNPSQDSQ